MKRTVCILGSTGSVGINTLDVIARNPEHFSVCALTAHSNWQKLAEQCLQFQPKIAVLVDPQHANDLEDHLLGSGCKTLILRGANQLKYAVEADGCDTVMAAIVGAAGLEPTLHAARLGRRILLANKEALVISGALLMHTAARNQAEILPVDSEHNGLFQALPKNFRNGLADCGVNKLTLTASGGPFLNRCSSELDAVTPEQACAHPNWDMGRKISVDSATLMNKGLELIEARWLFAAGPQQLDVVVHPQSIVHALVEYSDGSVLAQLGNPDMRTPISHALGWPKRIPSGVETLDLTNLAKLEFQAPDVVKFRCLQLAFDVLRADGDAAILLNAANEEAVQAFLQHKIKFTEIAEVVADTLQHAGSNAPDDLAALLALDSKGRRLAQAAIERTV